MKNKFLTESDKVHILSLYRNHKVINEVKKRTDSCPPATQDIDINLENRNKSLKSMLMDQLTQDLI